MRAVVAVAQVAEQVTQEPGVRQVLGPQGEAWMSQAQAALESARTLSDSEGVYLARTSDGSVVAAAAEAAAKLAEPLAERTYDDTPYPAAPYRLLAAFRMWAVIRWPPSATCAGPWRRRSGWTSITSVLPVTPSRLTPGPFLQRLATGATVLALAPVVTVVGYETLGHRHQEAALTRMVEVARGVADALAFVTDSAAGRACSRRTHCRPGGSAIR